MGTDLGNSLDYISKCWVAATASLNSNYICGKGSAFDTMEIRTLADYMKRYDGTKLGNWNPELSDNNKLARTYVIRITLPYPVNENESPEADLIIDSKGQDIGLVTLDKQGKEANFKLDPKIEKNIKLMTQNVEKEMGPEYAKEFLPRNVEELAKKISKDQLIPKNQEEVNRRKDSALGNFEHGGIEEKQEDEEEIIDKLPEKDKDKIIDACEKSGMNIGDLKQSVTVREPKSITNLIEDEGISPTGGPVLILRFRNKEANTGSDEIVMVQGDRTEKRDRYNDTISKYMDDRAKSNTTIESLEDKETVIQYQDEKGETVRENLVGVPSDISDLKKEEFKQKFNEIMKKREANIESVKASDVENKEELLTNISSETYSRILDLMNEYGVQLPKTVAELEDDDFKGSEQIQEEQEKDDDNDGIGGYPLPWETYD